MCRDRSGSSRRARPTTSATWLVLAAAVLLSAACQAIQAPAPSPEDRLTANPWRRVVDQGFGHAAEVTEWAFHANGAFRRSFTSDYSENQTGSWRLEKSSPITATLFLAFDGPEPRRRAVVSLILADDALRLAENTYQAAPLEAETRWDAEPGDAGTFALWRSLTASDWSSESAPPPGYADAYAFRDDGGYTARVAETDCDFSGSWSLFSSGEERGELRLSVPAHSCDPRGPTEVSVRELPVELEEGKLLLYKTAYRPVPIVRE